MGANSTVKANYAGAARRGGTRLPAAAADRGHAEAMIGPVRHNPSTVVVLAGRTTEQVLAAVGQSLNIVLVRPRQPPSGPDAVAGAGLDAAAGALRRAAGITAPYVLVVADPLSSVAAAWQAMWEVTAEPRGSDEFELRAAEAMAAWRAKLFELPDYYLVLADETAPGGADAPGAASAPGAGDRRADFYLGPLRSVRPNRVSVAAGSSPETQADALLSELGSLRPGPWWPSLDEVFRTVRGFYPGTLAESPSAGKASLLS
jgi:hypothetical protein